MSCQASAANPAADTQGMGSPPQAAPNDDDLISAYLQAHPGPLTVTVSLCGLIGVGKMSLLRRVYPSRSTLQ